MWLRVASFGLELFPKLRALLFPQMRRGQQVVVFQLGIHLVVHHQPRRLSPPGKDHLLGLATAVLDRVYTHPWDGAGFGAGESTLKLGHGQHIV